jgi:hypothetical protein
MVFCEVCSLVSARQLFKNLALLARVDLLSIITEVSGMNATVQEVKDAAAAVEASQATLITKVGALESLANTIKAQLDALIAANNAGTGITGNDLTAIRDRLVADKAALDAASATIDATIAADSPVAPPA